MEQNQEQDLQKKEFKLVKKVLIKKAIVKISEGDRIDFFANL